MTLKGMCRCCILYVLLPNSCKYVLTCVTEPMLWRLFHRCRIDQYYRRDIASWAIVTGSTDGIGKCLVEELLSHGFNVIVHGRNPTKVARVVEEFQALYPKRQIESVIADLSRLEDVSNIVSALKDKHIKVFINNAGATDRAFFLFAEMPWSEVERTMHVGVMFTTRLIHEVLPILTKNTPSVMINVGSMSCQVPVPYVPLYAATKGYLRSLTRCMAAEARLAKTGVEIIYVDVHNVNSAANHQEVSFFVPSSQTMAKSIINVIGCNYGIVTPYWAHELSVYFTHIIPARLLEKLSASGMQAVLDAEKEFQRQNKRS